MANLSEQLTKLYDTQVEDFKAYLDKLKLLSTACEAKLSEIETKNEETSNLKSQAERMNLESNRKQDLLDTKLREAEESLARATQTVRENEEILSQSEALKKQLEERAIAQVKEDEALTEKRQSLDKKSKWIEMEERRLTYLDRTLKVIMQDKDIQKRLDDLQVNDLKGYYAFSI